MLLLPGLRAQEEDAPQPPSTPQVLAGAAGARSLATPKATPRPTQFVPLPPTAEADGYARHAESLPIFVGPVLAPAWVLMDAASGRVLAGRDIDRKMFPASTTKTMTTLLAVESGKLNQTFTIGPGPAKTGEASVFLAPGERFVLRDLVKAALIRSANDSCVAIAEALSGSVPAFVQRMNARARALGAIHTHFANPHGLHDPHHFTTPRDLALIARRAMSLPAFSSIVGTREARIHGNALIGASRLLLNRNRLLFRWEGCEGVKTGYTRQAGNCLIASSTRLGSDGRPWRLIAVVMHSPNSWSDAYNALVHEGFEKFSPQVLARQDEEFSLMRDEQPIPARLAREVRVALGPGEQAERRVIPERAQKPGVALQKGERVAHAEWRVGGRVVASAPLFAADDVPASAALGFATRVFSSPARARIERGFQANRLYISGALLLGALALALAAVRAARPRSRPRSQRAPRPRPARPKRL